MNTKTDGISSGLVAVAWMAADEGGDLEFNTINKFSCGRTEGTPLVRLSDAEAIIAQKDAEILEQCRLNGMGAERELTLLAKVERQSAALKLAREAFYAINAEAKEFMSYENARNNFSDDTDERKAYERAMMKASELTKKALAAINEVLGE